MLLATMLGVCPGCDLLPNVLSFGAGFIAGHWSGTQFEVTTVERRCYQNGVEVPCP